MYDLLEDPLITVRRLSGEDRLSLPQLLAALAAGDVSAYPRLRRHQMDPFHVFTCQLAAASLARAGIEAPPTDAAFWRDALVNLADGQRSAWHLVVEDPLKPAFMQSPLLDPSELSGFRLKARSPDELDVLVTAKGHDVKMARAMSTDPELWFCAVLTYQTTSGFLGAGNYGIVRMNGGFASRAFVFSVADPSPAPRFLEELPLVMEARERAIGANSRYKAPGIVLTWGRVWDRTRPAYSFNELDPLFIEAARPIRLLVSGANIAALGSTSKTRQIKGPENGDTGDPWTVLNVTDKKKGVSALTVSESGFTPHLLTNILFQKGYLLTPLQVPRPGNGRVYLCASVLVRGQGTTGGFHEIRLPIPDSARRMFRRQADIDRLAQHAQVLLGDAATVERNCLRPALVSFVEGGAEAPSATDTVAKWVSIMMQPFTIGWRDAYFPSLWRAASGDLDLDSARAQWVELLIGQARSALERARDCGPLPAGRRLRAEVRSRSILERGFHKTGLTSLISREIA